MTRKLYLAIAALSACFLLSMVQHSEEGSHSISLPTSKVLTVPVPGFIARTNSFPATIVLSPDGRYAAFLNQGYGTQESGVRQSIAILDLRTNQLRDFPDDRLRGDEKSTAQSYFIGLAFSTDGKHIFASMGAAASNGIAVYQFTDGEVASERFIAIPAQRVAPGKTVTLDTGSIGGYCGGLSRGICGVEFERRRPSTGSEQPL